MNRTFFLVVIIFVVILTAFSGSCGHGGKHSGELTSQLVSSDTGGRGGVQQSASNNETPTPNGNTGRTLSVEQAIAEVEAYEPAGDDAATMDWHAFAILKHELIRQLEEIATTRGVSSFPIRNVTTTGHCTGTEGKTCVGKGRSTDGESRDTSSGGRDDFIDMPDIYVMPHFDGSNTITWLETINGDFDGDGEVNVADITPIANNYLKTYGQGYGDAVSDAGDRYLLYAKGTVYSEGTGDTDAASELGVPDITVIAQNYLMGPPSNGFAGYDVWRVPLAGGTAERIPNPTDASAPTVVRTGMYEAGTEFTVNDDARMTSGVKGTSEIDENGEGWSNGDYYYWIEPRDSEDTTAPANPNNPKFNVNITYTTPFRLRAGQEVELKINVWGDATPISYGVNWGDGATDSTAATSTEFIFAHTYSQDGTYVPIVAIQATTQSGNVMLMQEAPPVVIFPETPYAPTGLDVSPQGDGVALNWDIVDPTPGDIFRIYYSLRRGDSRPILLGTTSDNTFFTSITEQLPGGKSVFFKVTCERGDFESSFSNESKYPESGIAAPMLTILGTSDDTRVDLSWTSVADTADYTVAGYTVYKETSLNDANPVICSTPAVIPAAQTAYTYIPGEDEDSLYFFVRTVADDDRTSGRSNEVGWAKDIPEPPVNLEATSAYRSITVTWDASPSLNVTGYRVYYGTKLDKTDQSQGYEASKDSRMYTISHTADHPVANGTEYYLWVAAERVGVLSEQATPATATPFNTPPIAGFVASPSSGGAPLNVTFNALTGSPNSSDPDGATLTYDWDYDDGTAHGTGSNPTHEYADEGEYTPVLTVTDEEGATDVYTGTPITVATGAPVAVANASPKVGSTLPLTVNFNANGSTDEDGTIAEYAWQFYAGDDWHDYTAQGGVASHQYTQYGTYTATLRVTDDDGKKSYSSVNIKVNHAPVANAGANPTSGAKPLLVTFNANGSTDEDGTITKYEWDFTNNGSYDWSSTSTGNTTYTYTSSGTYTAKLRVTDNDGIGSTDSIQIVVNALPVAHLDADVTSGPAPLTVNFDASGSNDPDGSITKFEWDWEGDGTYDLDSGISATQEHVYNTISTYNPVVRITDNSGATDTESISISVNGWVHTWGGSEQDQGKAIDVDTSGNLYISGYTQSFGAGTSDVLTMKYDADGVLQWVKTWGGTGTDTAWGVAVADDGCAFVALESQSYAVGGVEDAVLLKYGSDGTLEYQKSWDYGDVNYFTRAAIDISGNIYLCGAEKGTGAGGYDAILVKVNSDCQELWNTVWGGDDRESLWDVFVSDSGYIYATGLSESFDVGGGDVLLLKYDSSGNVIWARTWGTTEYDYAYAIDEDSEGNIYIGGQINYPTRIETLLLKYDSNGNLIWQRTWQGGYSEIAGLTVTPEDRVFSSGLQTAYGNRNYEAALTEYTIEGNVVMRKSWGLDTADQGEQLLFDTFGNICMTGWTISNTGTWMDINTDLDETIGSVSSPEGTATHPTSTITNLSGSESAPTGVEDTGGGPYDVLVMKFNPDDL